MRAIFGAAALTLAAACAPAGEKGGQTADCPVLRSSGWTAHVDAMPGPGPGPELIVTGEVQLPTGGWSVELVRGPVLEVDPPIQELELRADPPEGGATQAIATHRVRATVPALQRYGAVRIRCAGEILAEIEEVGVAH